MGVTVGILFLSVIDPEITLGGTFTPLITKYVRKNRITIWELIKRKQDLQCYSESALGLGFLSVVVYHCIMGCLESLDKDYL